MNHIWPEVLSVAAIVGALASVFISYKAYRIAAVQALPRLKIGGMATWGASRSVAFEVEWIPGHPDWVVTSASIRRNWRRRYLLAHSELEYSHEAPDGEIINEYKSSGPWKRRITFDWPVKQGGIVLHRDTPDCEVTLKMVLTTSPSPTVFRHIKSRRYGPPSLS
jgi:hypothetical protein